MGATPAGLQYLITKSMLQASKALNLSLYLLLKSDQASNSKNNLNTDMMSYMDDDNGDDIRNHPVMDRLNQLSQLTDKLQESVEEKTPGLKEQMSSLVKAAALMAGGDLSSSDDDSDNSDDEGHEDETESSEVHDTAEVGTNEVGQELASDDDDSESSSDSEDEMESQAAIQQRIMTEARFALRNQDIDNDNKANKDSSKKRKRRLAPTSTSDYGDETEEVTDKALAASRKLASTMNSIEQKSTSFNDKKKNKLVGDDEGDDNEYDDLQKGLAMMEEEFGKGSDEDEDMSGGDEDDEEGLGDSDEDDFYQSIKSKSKAKKEAKKQLYAVAPKYPRLEGEVEGTDKCYSIIYAQHILKFIYSCNITMLLLPLLYCHRRACHWPNYNEK